MSKSPHRFSSERRERISFVVAVLLGLGFISLLVTGVPNFSGWRSCDSYKGPIVPPPKIPPFQWKGTGLITLWFDDAWVTQFTVAAPIMEQAGFQGAVAVAIRFVCHSAFMTWDQLRILQSKGWETTAHSVTHNCDLNYYTPDKIEYELLQSKKLIEARGLRADQFVMPCGYSQHDIDYADSDFRPQIAPASKKYYNSYRTTNGVNINPLPVLLPYELSAFEPGDATSDDEIKQMIEKTAKQKGWLILVFHQLDDTHRPFAVSADQFKRIIQMIKDSGLPVVLPTQALAVDKKP